MPPTKGGKRPLTSASGSIKGKGKGKGPGGKKAPTGGKAPKKSGSAVGGEHKARRHKRVEKWATYINRALKQVYKTHTLSRRAMSVITSFVEDMFSKIQQEAVNVAKLNKVRTLTAREIQTSARLLLPPELAKHAMSEGTKAVAKYNQSITKDDRV